MRASTAGEPWIADDSARSVRRWTKAFSGGAVALLVGVGALTARWDKPLPSPAGEFRTSSFVMTLPPSFPKLGERHQGATTSVIFGEKEGCGRYYERFLVVAWSAADIPVRHILPSWDYELEFEGATEPIRLGTERNGTLSELGLSVTRPCGRKERTRVALVRFTRPGHGERFAVAGFIEPFLPKDALVAIARSVAEP